MLMRLMLLVIRLVSVDDNEVDGVGMVLVIRLVAST